MFKMSFSLVDGKNGKYFINLHASPLDTTGNIKKWNWAIPPKLIELFNKSLLNFLTDIGHIWWILRDIFLWVILFGALRMQDVFICRKYCNIDQIILHIFITIANIFTYATVFASVMISVRKLDESENGPMLLRKSEMNIINRTYVKQCGTMQTNQRNLPRSQLVHFHYFCYTPLESYGSRS